MKQEGGMTYVGELAKAMSRLGEQPATIFLGQQIRFPGNGLYKTLQGVPLEKKIELGIMEDAQLGIAIGMARAGRVPITIYPRMDFLLLAMNQLVNHLDKYPVKVIIRVCVGSKTPLNPGAQHCGDYTEWLEGILNKVKVVRLLHPLNVVPAYLGAYASKSSHLLIEYGDRYRQKL